ncbi:MAG: Ppx/GppA family phosphatase [Candidatus Bathyarchaeota archaeon]|nr:Ppx/GppA family phosphatase [Candidatus Termiticorpusculum sp.]
MEQTVTILDQIIGFIDIGTNAVRLLVVKINPNFSYTIISQEKEVVRLGEDEFSDNILKPEAMNRAIFVCGKFLSLAKTYGATKILTAGTSAIREAENKATFLQRLFNETGLTVQVISGEEEARLIYKGVLSGIDIGEEKALFIDLGGGSTEIAIGDQYQLHYTCSLKVGAIRLTTQFIGEGWTKPISDAIYKEIKNYVHYNLRQVKMVVKECGLKLAWGSSGTIINLAEVAGKLFKKNNGDLVLNRKNLKRLASTFCSLTLEERRKLPGINPYRADIIVAGAAIVDAIMDDFGLDEISVSHKELRDGMLVEYLSTFESYKELQKTPLHNRNILHLGRSFNFDEAHSKIVSTLALQLFDSAKQLKLHCLSDKYRDLLDYAATLHDIGDIISFNNHHLHSHYIISNAELYGFDRSEITIIANIARFHRKKLPTSKALKKLDLTEEAKLAVMILSTLLRIAEKLDRSHTGIVNKAEFTDVKDGVVTLFFSCETDCSMEKWSIQQNKRAFYEVFQKQLAVSCSVNQ